MRYISKGVCLALITLTPILSQAQISTCQLSKPQSIENWRFDIRMETEKPTWEATLDAEKLYSIQQEYSTQKKGMFTPKVVIPASLGFFEPKLKWSLEKDVLVSKTLEGKPCQEVRGATLVVLAKPNIQLAKELQEKNCIAKAALSHQLEHFKALEDSFIAAKQDKERIKKLVFAHFEKNGASGDDPKMQKISMTLLEKAALEDVAMIFDPFLKKRRLAVAENMETLSKLHHSCDAKFMDQAITLVPNSLSLVQKRKTTLGEGSGH